jgi:hypothetical protein
MRKQIEVQLTLGRTAIERVSLPLWSRDELPPVLAGLRWIFQKPSAPEKARFVTSERPKTGKLSSKTVLLSC